MIVGTGIRVGLLVLGYVIGSTFAIGLALGCLAGFVIAGSVIEGLPISFIMSVTLVCFMSLIVPLSLFVERILIRALLGFISSFYFLG